MYNSAPLRSHVLWIVQELESLCQDIDECVAFDTDGRMLSHIGLEKGWISFEGTVYVADIDVCQAGLTTCYGNCTCLSSGKLIYGY